MRVQHCTVTFCQVLIPDTNSKAGCERKGVGDVAKVIPVAKGKIICYNSKRCKSAARGVSAAEGVSVGEGVSAARGARV